MIYAGCFVISLSLFYYSKYQRNYIRNMIDLVALFLPCLLAGIRANTVGTDVTVYLEPMITNARNAKSFGTYLYSSWMQGFNTRSVADIEIGFSFLVYYTIKVFNSRYVLQFIIQILTICPVYIGLRKKDDENLWIGMLVYFCMFYNISMNIMRQVLAMSFVFLAIQYLLNNQKRKMLFYLIVACLFHNAALLGFFIWFIHDFIEMKFLGKNMAFKTAKKRLYFLVFVGLLMLVLQKLIINLMENMGLSYYTQYIEGKISFLPNQVIIRLPVLLVCILLKKKLFAKEGNLFYFYVCCIIYTILLAQYASITGVAYRISMFFSFLQIGFIPDICSLPIKIRYGIRTLNLNKFIMVLYLISWWVYYCLIVKDSTLPYITDLL